MSVKGIATHFCLPSWPQPRNSRPRVRSPESPLCKFSDLFSPPLQSEACSPCPKKCWLNTWPCASVSCGVAQGPARASFYLCLSSVPSLGCYEGVRSSPYSQGADFLTTELTRSSLPHCPWPQHGNTRDPCSCIPVGLPPPRPARGDSLFSSSVPLVWALTRWFLELLGVWLSRGQGDSFSHPYLEWVLPGTTEREEGCSISTGPPPRSPDCATLGWG